MTPEQRRELMHILEQGGEIAPEWASIIFPAIRREYELVYHGKQREEDILAETLTIPLQPVRSFANGCKAGNWHNMLVFGDNLQVLKSLVARKKEGSLCSEDGTPGVRLVYIDPPFATKNDFQGNQSQKAYRDKILGAQFLEFLRKRLILLKELLSDDGALVVHLDWKKGHYVKVLLDEIFGESRFRNEIIWWYYNKMQGNVKRFPSNHETLLYYTKSDDYTFNAQHEERQEGRVKQLKRVWDSNKKKLVNAKGADGKVVYIETDDRRIDDVWRLSMLQPADRTEATGYPTQKPESLLALLMSATTGSGDLVMDCFCGSGTTLAVAEKLGRRWIGIDSGKYAIYTVQKRLLNLHAEIGNDGPPLSAKPFTLYNAGLYEFSRLKELPWKDWRFFALQLFQCRDAPHSVGGVQLDGYLRGSSVMVFNHLASQGAKIHEQTIANLHECLEGRIGDRFFIIAPALKFDFLQDYIELGGVRYFALRIPYSIIHELHQREFQALKQPSDEVAVNELVEAVGFDFVRTPDLEIELSTSLDAAKKAQIANIRIVAFRSDAVLRTPYPSKDNLETLSMVLVDCDYDQDSKVFNLGRVFYAETLAHEGWTIRLPLDELGETILAIFTDIYGNEARRTISRQDFGVTSKRSSRPLGGASVPPKAKKAPPKAAKSKSGAKKKSKAAQVPPRKRRT